MPNYNAFPDNSWGNFENRFIGDPRNVTEAYRKVIGGEDSTAWSNKRSEFKTRWDGITFGEKRPLYYQDPTLSNEQNWANFEKADQEWVNRRNAGYAALHNDMGNFFGNPNVQNPYTAQQPTQQLPQMAQDPSQSQYFLRDFFNGTPEFRQKVHDSLPPSMPAPYMPMADLRPEILAKKNYPPSGTFGSIAGVAPFLSSNNQSPMVKTGASYPTSIVDMYPMLFGRRRWNTNRNQ